MCVQSFIILGICCASVCQDACSAVAILLHYFWLVCFMWMLMEGAVLYVALVKVFDTQHLKYVVAFTVISYGK